MLEYEYENEKCLLSLHHPHQIFFPHSDVQQDQKYSDSEDSHEYFLMDKILKLSYPNPAECHSFHLGHYLMNVKLFLQ